MTRITANKGEQHGAAAAEHQNAEATKQQVAAKKAPIVAPTPEEAKGDNGKKIG